MSNTPAPSAHAVRRSLRALADGTAPRSSPADVVAVDAAARAIAEAEAATTCAQRASAYLADGRLAALDRAVDAAATERSSDDHDDDLARRGRAARRTLRRLQTALLDARTDSQSSPAVGQASD